MRQQANPALCVLLLIFVVSVICVICAPEKNGTIITNEPRRYYTKPTTYGMSFWAGETNDPSVPAFGQKPWLWIVTSCDQCWDWTNLTIETSIEPVVTKTSTNFWRIKFKP